MEPNCGLGIAPTSRVSRGVSPRISHQFTDDGLTVNHMLTEDTKAIILLCGVLGRGKTESPLTLTDYSSLVHRLVEMKMRPGDLLKGKHLADVSAGSGIEMQRLESLLGRGVQLGFAVEEWQRNGVWIVSRGDKEYPTRVKKHLRNKAPPLLFGVGDRALLAGGGVGVVGARNVDQAGADFTREVADVCARSDMPVVSGGARGVDQIAISTAVESGGIAVGVLAAELLRKSLEKSARRAIADGRLLLISPYNPHAGFTVGTAMARNKLTYAMADYGLVVSAEYQKGGTWAGAEEELKRDHARPVFVRMGPDVPPGNQKLLALGAVPYPAVLYRHDFRKQLDASICDDGTEVAARGQKTLEHVNSPIGGLSGKPMQAENGLFDMSRATETTLAGRSDQLPELGDSEQAVATVESDTQGVAKSVYDAALPIILQELSTPMSAQRLATALEVNRAQLTLWLNRAVSEKVIIKQSRPVLYKRGNDQ